MSQVCEAQDLLRLVPLMFRGRNLGGYLYSFILLSVCSSMVESLTSTQITRVRFPLHAPISGFNGYVETNVKLVST